jgi:hypothetical protein
MERLSFVPQRRRQGEEDEIYCLNPREEAHRDRDILLYFTY